MEEDFKLKLQNYDLIFGIKFGPPSEPHVLNCHLRMLQINNTDY